MMPATDSQLVLRTAADSDLRQGRLTAVLDQLSDTSRPPPLHQTWKVQKYVYVACLDGAVIGTASLMVETKLIHDGGKVGYIEDVVIDEPHRGQGHGRSVIAALSDRARELGCYKVILSCAEGNVGFYERCGFRRHEVTMRLDLPATAESP